MTKQRAFEITGIKQPSFHAVRERLQAIRRIDLKQASIDFLKQRLTLPLTGHGLATPVLGAGQELYRGVKWPNRPRTKSHLSYPPSSLVTMLGRANRPNQSMFYASVARAAVFFETRCEAGDHLAVSRWRLMEKTWANNVGFAPSVISRKATSRKNRPWWEVDSEFPWTPTNGLVHEFLSEEFARDIPPGDEHRYKLSVAITEKLLGNIRNAGADFSAPKQQKIGTLVYPTLAMRANSDNVVMLPETADGALQLISVEYIRIDEVQPDLRFKVTVLDFANSLGADETIEWKGRNAQWTVPPGAQVRVAVENGQWIVRDLMGKLVEPT